MREAIHIRLLLTVLRASITAENQRIPAVITCFLGEASHILVRVDHPMFLEVHNYLNSRPLLDLNGVPALQRFLHSPRPSAKLEREWIIRVLEYGLKTPSELSLMGLRAPNSYENLAVHLKNEKPQKGSKAQLLPMLLTHLSSVPLSIYSASSERHHIWNIIRSIIMLDAPVYKNSLAGPTGILGFIANWTSSHHLHINGIVSIAAANVPSVHVFAEITSTLEAIASTPELQKGITRSVAPLLLPIVNNILQYLELSFCKNPNIFATSTTFTNSDQANRHGFLFSNPYFKLLAPCVKILKKIAIGMPYVSGVSSHSLLTCLKLLEEFQAQSGDSPVFGTLKSQIAHAVLLSFNLDGPYPHSMIELNLLRFAISTLIQSDKTDPILESLTSFLCRFANYLTKTDSLLIKVMMGSFKDDSGQSSDLLTLLVALARHIKILDLRSPRLSMTYCFAFLMANYRKHIQMPEKKAKQDTWHQFFQSRLDSLLSAMPIPQPLTPTNIEAFFKNANSKVNYTLFAAGVALCSIRPRLKDKLPRHLRSVLESH